MDYICVWKVSAIRKVSMNNFLTYILLRLKFCAWSTTGQYVPYFSIHTCTFCMPRIVSSNTLFMAMPPPPPSHLDFILGTLVI